MLIRPAVVADAEALTDLHLDVWEEAYAGLMPGEILAARRDTRAARIERWATVIANPGTSELLAEDDGRLIGFVSAGAGRDAQPALPGLELMALYVRAAVYGAGIGHRLCEAAVGAEPAYLWVLDGNERAIGFYQRQGFEFDGTSRADHLGTEHRMVRN